MCLKELTPSFCHTLVAVRLLSFCQTLRKRKRRQRLVFQLMGIFSSREAHREGVRSFVRRLASFLAAVISGTTPATPYHARSRGRKPC